MSIIGQVMLLNDHLAVRRFEFNPLCRRFFSVLQLNDKYLLESVLSTSIYLIAQKVVRCSWISELGSSEGRVASSGSHSAGFLLSNGLVAFHL